MAPSRGGLTLAERAARSGVDPEKPKEVRPSGAKHCWVTGLPGYPDHCPRPTRRVEDRREGALVRQGCLRRRRRRPGNPHRELGSRRAPRASRRMILRDTQSDRAITGVLASASAYQEPSGSRHLIGNADQAIRDVAPTIAYSTVWKSSSRKSGSGGGRAPRDPHHAATTCTGVRKCRTIGSIGPPSGTTSYPSSVLTSWRWRLISSPSARNGRTYWRLVWMT